MVRHRKLKIYSFRKRHQWIEHWFGFSKGRALSLLAKCGLHTFSRQIEEPLPFNGAVVR
jgi:hypothetical protein